VIDWTVLLVQAALIFAWSVIVAAYHGNDEDR